MEIQKINTNPYTYKPLLKVLTLFISDISTLLLSFLLAFYTRRFLIRIMGGVVDFKILAPVFILLCIFIIFLFAINGLYPGDMKSGVTELKSIFTSIFLSYLIFGLSLYFFRIDRQISRFVFIMTFFLSCGLMTLSRLWIHNRFSLLSWWNQPVVIVGKEQFLANVIQKLSDARRFALKPEFALVTDWQEGTSNISGVPAFPNSLEAQRKIRDFGIKLAIFVNQTSELDTLQKERMYELSLSFPNMIHLMGESPVNSLSMKPLDLAGHPGLLINYNLLNPFSRFIKRIEDLLISFVSLLVTLPFSLIASLLIRLDSEGPVIFSQKRLGRDGCEFDCYKFRTMVLNAEEILEDLLKSDERMLAEYLEFHKIRNDPRVTRIGRFLRKTGLDELPQILNVLKGEMSIIGPRAYLPSEIDDMGESKKLILRVSPGITGWWQVMGRQDISFQNRLRMDEYYISNFSLWLDFYILVKTFWVMISGKGE